MSIANFAELKEYKDKIGALRDITDGAVEGFGKIYHEYTCDSVEGLKNLQVKLGQANFKIIMLGKFSTGKSSLINTLLGEDVLPDSLSPCTAYINEITYGEEKQATIYFKHPLPEKWEDFVQNARVKEHILSHNGGQVGELVIPLEELADCVTIPWDDEADDIFEDSTNLNISPFEKAVIQYPCELCRNGIEIIDSPGLDENQDRTELVDKYLKKVDAVVYVMTNIATGGDSDKDIIRTYLSDNDIKNVFFVCNLFGIPLKMAQKQLFGRLKKVFGDKTLLGERGIHLVNIKDMQNTGVADFENALAEYLNNEKGQAQLTSYTEMLTKLTNAIVTASASFRCVHDVKLDDINAKIAATKALLADDERLLVGAEKVIAAIKENLAEYVLREAKEIYKKTDYIIRLDIRDQEMGEDELANDATEVETKALGKALADEYTNRFQKEYREYIYTELTKELAVETSPELQKLQGLVDAFAKNLSGENCPEKPNVITELSAIEQLIDEKFAKELQVDLASFVASSALNLDAALDRIMQDIFYIYSYYKNDNRGAKLTTEVQSKVTLEVFNRIERVKRTKIADLTKELLVALDAIVFDKVLNGMADEIARQKNILAEEEATKLVILDNQKAEHKESAEILATLDDNLQQLATLQAEINA